MCFIFIHFCHRKIHSSTDGWAACWSFQRVCNWGAVLLCGNLRRIHLHLTQIYATTNFLFNLVEQLFEVFFLSRWRIWGHCVINAKCYLKTKTWTFEKISIFKFIEDLVDIMKLNFPNLNVVNPPSESKVMRLL